MRHISPLIILLLLFAFCSHCASQKRGSASQDAAATTGGDDASAGDAGTTSGQDVNEPDAPVPTEADLDGIVTPTALI